MINSRIAHQNKPLKRRTQMTNETIKASISPCGLSCETCFAYVDGDIRRYSLKLKEKLGNFEPYARRFETLLDNPVFKKYPDFREMLDFLASENCKGCRNENCKLFRDCNVRPCHQEKQVDFCYECTDFPCNQTHFDEGLYKIFVKLNEKIRKTGIEAFYEKSRTSPRYI